MTTTKITASQLMVNTLEDNGVRYIFALPGEENLDFLEAVRNSKLELILTRHEQAAGFMAATVGRLTGQVGVCLTTLGPGATNLITAAAYAQLGGMPILIITGQKPLKDRQQGSFQILDTVDIFKPITKLSQQIIDSNNIALQLSNAIRVATEERPGAVHLELPEDIAAEQVIPHKVNIVQPRRPIAEQKAIKQAVSLIEKSRKPLLLIGASANRKRTAKMLQQFISKTGLYFFNTQMGKGVLPETDPHYLGTAALSDGDYLHCLIEQSDLIINVGHDSVEKPPFIMKSGSGPQVIHLNFYSAQLDNVYFPQVEVIGDIANALWQITELINPQEWDFEYFKKFQKVLHQQTDFDTSNSTFPLKPQEVVSVLQKQVANKGLVALDNGMYKIWFTRNYRALKPNSLLLDNALATMGAGLPVAIASKLLHPELPVVAVCGDGGFMMNSQELETAVRLKLNLIVLILNDNAYGMIKWKQTGKGLVNYGLDFNNPDFVKYAASYTTAEYPVKGYQITPENNLTDLLSTCLADKKGLHLIEVPVDYSDNKKVLIDQLQTKSCHFDDSKTETTNK